MNQAIIPLGNILCASDLGAILAQRRKSQGLTQADLAGLAQLGTRFISDLENGKGTIQMDKALSICTLLGLQIVVCEKGEPGAGGPISRDVKC